MFCGFETAFTLLSRLCEQVKSLEKKLRKRRLGWAGDCVPKNIFLHSHHNFICFLFFFSLFSYSINFFDKIYYFFFFGKSCEKNSQIKKYHTELGFNFTQFFLLCATSFINFFCAPISWQFYTQKNIFFRFLNESHTAFWW